MEQDRELFSSLNLELIRTETGFEMRRSPSVSPRIVWPALMLPIFVTCLAVGQTIPAILTGGTLVLLCVATIRGWNPVLAKYVSGRRVLTTAADELTLNQGCRLQTKKLEDGPVEVFVESGAERYMIYRWTIRSQYYDVPYPDVVRLAALLGEQMELEVEIGRGIEAGSSS